MSGNSVPHRGDPVMRPRRLGRNAPAIVSRTSRRARRLEPPVRAVCGPCDVRRQYAFGRHAPAGPVTASCLEARGPRRGRGYHLDLLVVPAGNGASRPGRRRRTKMLGLKRLSVAQYERALVFRERSLERVLTPGVYWLWDPLQRLAVKVFDVNTPELTLPRAEMLIAESRALLDPHVQVVELGDREVGLLYKNERLSGVLAPGSLQAYWRGPVKVRVEVRDIGAEYTLDARTARVLAGVKGASGVGDAISVVEVPDTAIGLLIVDGELRGVLKPGLSAYWKYQRNLRVELVELRLQAMEVAGQEILTRDKVSLRVNLTALWQVTDAVKA